jgi:hypothetical protein
VGIDRLDRSYFLVGNRITLTENKSVPIFGRQGYSFPAKVSLRSPNQELSHAARDIRQPETRSEN